MRPTSAFAYPAAPTTGGPTPAEPPRPAPVTEHHGQTPRSILITLVGALIAIAVLGSIAWRFTGGSLFTIATPSMCPDLCVGTLVFDRPAVGPVEVGVVVTFRPPGTSVVYTHRVVAVLADGSFKTAGDALKKVDPWTVPRSNVIGHVVANVRGLGWLWRSLPWMAGGLACIVIARRTVRDRFRRQVDLLSITMLIVVPVLVMRPLLRASVISWHVIKGGSVVMTLVNDGLLPARFHVTVGPIVSHVAPGQVITMVGRPQASGLVAVGQTASFYWWEWALASFVVLLPMLGFLGTLAWGRLRSRRSRPVDPHPGVIYPPWHPPASFGVPVPSPMNPATVSARGQGTNSA